MRKTNKLNDNSVYTESVPQADGDSSPNKTETFRINNEQYRQLEDSSGESIGWTDPEERFIFANAKVHDLFGLSQGELIGKSLYDFCDEINRQMIYAQTLSNRGGIKTTYELEIVRPDKQIRTLVIKNTPRFGSRGEYLGVFRLFCDITEQKSLKKELNLLKKAFETIQLGITISDLKRKILFTNQADASMHGFTVEELQGKESCIFGLPENRNNNKELNPKNFKTWKRETLNARKDGSLFPVELISDIVSDKNGNPTAIITCCLDISKRKAAELELQNAYDLMEKRVKERTAELQKANESLLKEIEERKKIEYALRESEERYRNIVESSTHAIIIHDMKQILYINPEAVKILGGTSADDFMGISIDKIVHSDYVKIDKERIENIFKKKISKKSEEEKFVRLDGEVIDVKVSGILIQYQEKSVVLSTLTDITETKMAEEKDLLHQLQLMQADKMVALGTLVSGVAHEINNPNNFIMLNAEIFSDIWESISPILEQYNKSNKKFVLAGFPYQKAKKKIKKLIEGLLEGSMRIKAIVNELKNFARPEALESFQKLDVNKIILSSVALTQNMIKRSTRHFSLNTTDGLPQIYGSFQRLEQVVINLIQNSCQALVEAKSLTEGGLLISTFFEKKSNEVVISIKDGGIGIPEENLRFITDPFFTTKRTADGTGLGLSVSLRIIQDHGGSLHFKSKVNEGTEAIVRLPVISGTKGGKI